MLEEKYIILDTSLSNKIKDLELRVKELEICLQKIINQKNEDDLIYFNTFFDYFSFQI